MPTRSAPCARPGRAATASSAPTTTAPAGPVQEAVEGLDELVEAAVVVEVVGLHVGDDGDLGVEREERAVALVGLDAPATRRVSHTALVPISLTSPPMRKLGRSPASTRMSASIDVVVVLPWVPDTATHRRHAAMAASASARLQHHAGPGAGPRDLGVGVGDGGRDRHQLGAAHVGGVVADVHLHPAGGQSLEWSGELFRSLPVTRWPMAASTDAMALMPAPPTPTTWIRRRARQVDGLASAGTPITGRSTPGSPGIGARRRPRSRPARAWDRTSAATAATASGRPSDAAAARMASRRPGADRSASISSASRGPVHSASGTTTAAPAAVEDGGVGRLVVARGARAAARGRRARPRRPARPRCWRPPGHHDVGRLVEERHAGPRRGPARYHEPVGAPLRQRAGAACAAHDASRRPTTW